MNVRIPIRTTIDEIVDALVSPPVFTPTKVEVHEAKECHCAYCEYNRLKAAKAPPPYIQAMNGQDDPEDALQRILDKVKWTCK